MAEGKQVWRFQCDPPLGERDPVVTVFLGDLETYDGKVTVRQDTRDPVTLKLSELVVALANPASLTAMQDKQKADEKARQAEQQAAHKPKETVQ